MPDKWVSAHCATLVCIPLNISVNAENWCLIPVNTWLCGWRIKGLFVGAKRTGFSLSFLNADATMASLVLGGAMWNKLRKDRRSGIGKSWPRAEITDWRGSCYSRQCLGVWKKADLMEIQFYLWRAMWLWASHNTFSVPCFHNKKSVTVLLPILGTYLFWLSYEISCYWIAH